MNENSHDEPATGPAPTDDLLADPALAARHLADAVVAAGAVAVAMFRVGVKSWSKHNDSPVTEADIAVDTMLRDQLKALAPAYGWLSEETADDPSRLDRSRLWIIDPIDGTRAMAGPYRPDRAGDADRAYPLAGAAHGARRLGRT